MNFKGRPSYIHDRIHPPIANLSTRLLNIETIIFCAWRNNKLQTTNKSFDGELNFIRVLKVDA